MRYRISRLILPVAILLSIIGCKTNAYLSDIKADRITVDDQAQTDVDERIVAMIEPYKTGLDAKMNRVIGTLTTELIKGRPQSTLGNWMTDIIRERAEHYYGEHVDFAIQNYGGIRVRSIPAGDIQVGKIYELMPFDNKIVIVKLEGEVIMKMFDYLASNGGRPVSGSVSMKITQDDKARDVHIDGVPIDLSKSYTLALPDYVANSAGGCEFLRPLEQVETGWNVREAIIDYLDAHKEPMSAEIDDRIVKL